MPQDETSLPLRPGRKEGACTDLSTGWQTREKPKATGGGKDPLAWEEEAALGCRKPRLASGMACGGRVTSSRSDPLRPKPENSLPLPRVGRRALENRARMYGLHGDPGRGLQRAGGERRRAGLPATAGEAEPSS